MEGLFNKAKDFANSDNGKSLINKYAPGAGGAAGGNAHPQGQQGQQSGQQQGQGQQGQGQQQSSSSLFVLILSSLSFLFSKSVLTNFLFFES